MKSNVLSLFFLMGFSLLAASMYAQDDKAARPSPPAVATGILQGAHVAINYSAPSVKGRAIWGDLVPYGKVWRTGANEATTFETDKALTLGGKTLPAGKYSVFTIPGEKEWTWIFNSVWEQWGAYRYDESKDVLRITAVPQKSNSFQEQLKFEVMDNQVSLYWENLMVSF